MEITGSTVKLNVALPRAAESAPASGASPNAFGIGQANQPDVQLSAQAQIIQQREQQQPTQAAQQKPAAEESAPVSQNDFVRVSSSVGKASQSNGLSEKDAIELYKSIEKML